MRPISWVLSYSTGPGYASYGTLAISSLDDPPLVRLVNLSSTMINHRRHSSYNGVQYDDMPTDVPRTPTYKTFSSRTTQSPEQRSNSIPAICYRTAGAAISKASDSCEDRYKFAYAYISTFSLSFPVYTIHARLLFMMVLNSDLHNPLPTMRPSRCR